MAGVEATFERIVLASSAGDFGIALQLHNNGMNLDLLATLVRKQSDGSWRMKRVPR
jgi:hypothetical protein